MLGEKLGRKDDYLKQVLKQGSYREKEAEWKHSGTNFLSFKWIYLIYPGR